MANEKHVKLLLDDVGRWNAWRSENPAIRPDLSGANLTKANLRGMRLDGAFLNGANLTAAILVEANLSMANLSATHLTRANLSGAHLGGAILRGAYLNGADLSEAGAANTVFAGLDLRGVRGLDQIIHHEASTVGIDMLYVSGGEIPEVFLRGCGVPDTFITYARSLVGSAIEFYSCFISYSSKDEAFAKRLYASLQAEGVRCWYAPEDLRVGDRLRQTIDEAIRVREKLVLILSEASITSSWVEREVLAALAEEDRRGKTILFPVRLDDAVMETDAAWASGIWRDTRIGDFTRWKEDDAYQTAFERMLRDLKS